jgi:CRP/FNR family cyclic AMP-dependent transcriptional regulator
MGNEETEVINLKKDEILFLSSDKNSDVYIIKKGEVLVFVQNGSQVIPIAYLGAGEYVGELSYFEGKARTASIICTDDCEFIKLSTTLLNRNLPPWLKTIGKQLAGKIRSADELIRSKGIRKKNVETIKPLSIQEQARLNKITESFKEKTLKGLINRDELRE